MALEATALGLAIFLGAVGIGVGIQRGQARARERAARLQAELREARSALEAYREGVQKHFERTSDLFRDLTQQYSALYAHLAEGARELCRGEVPALGRGFGGAALRGGPEPPGAPAPTEAAESREPGGRPS